MRRHARHLKFLIATSVAACGSDGLSPDDTVGPDGARLEFAEGRVVVDVPPGALTTSVTLTVDPAESVPQDPLLVSGSAFDLGPDGLQFARPVMLTIAYDSDRLPEGVRAEELGLSKALNDQWQEIEGGTRDAGAAVVSAPITSLSIFGVVGARVASVSVTPENASVPVGSTVQLEATARDRDGMSLPGRSVTWTSSNGDVASVDAAGLVTGVAPGEATLTAISEGQSGSARVSVLIVPVASVDVTPPVAAVTVGETAQLEATVRDAGGNELLGRQVDWTTDNDAIATVDNTGLVTGVSVGAATVTATSEGQSGSALMSVSTVPVASVDVTPSSGSVAVGESIELTAIARDGAGNELIDRVVTWTSSDDQVATVSGLGVVTGVSTGQVTITATMEGQSGTADVGVTPATSPALSVVASGFDRPVYVTAPPGDTQRLFVAEQAGAIRIIEQGTVLGTAFLTIPSLSCCGERGLLSVAFHPLYDANGLFYVYYTDASGDTRVERYSVTANPNVADASSASLVLTVGQPAENHNGGLLKFGPDGYLYIGLGDGGGSNDQFQNGQDSTTLLGSLLRIDVDGGTPYAIPPDNPFLGDPDARPEIWAYGLRNPWRYSFDRVTGDLFIADVGQGSWEEVNMRPASSAGRENYGWNIMEGAHCFQSGSCDQTGLVLPVHEYGHSSRCSVTGGYVYRGSALPSIQGHYFYGDYCDGIVRSFRMVGGVATDHRNWAADFGTLPGITSFGEDANGEIYITGGGSVYGVVPATGAPRGVSSPDFH